MHLPRFSTKLSPFQATQSCSDQLPRSQNTAGLSLLECLVAIAVIALTGALITPPLVVATATRLQNRRAEQAIQLAQGEMDRIRALVEQGIHEEDVLPEKVANQYNFAEDGADPVEPPSAIAAVKRSVNSECNTYEGEPIGLGTVLPIDIDGDIDDENPADDCSADFYMQVFRTDSNTVVDGKPTEFDVGVRVYASSAVENLESGSVEIEEASLRFTDGRGDQSERPLAVLYSTMTWSELDFSLLCYHETGDCERDAEE